VRTRQKRVRTRVASSRIACARNSNWGRLLSIYRPLKLCRKTVRCASSSAATGSGSKRHRVPSPIKHLAVRLKAGERWRYESDGPPFSGRLESGVLSALTNAGGTGTSRGAFRARANCRFEARTPTTEFVLGSPRFRTGTNLEVPGYYRSTRRRTRFALANETHISRDQGAVVQKASVSSAHLPDLAVPFAPQGSVEGPDRARCDTRGQRRSRSRKADPREFLYYFSTPREASPWRNVIPDTTTRSCGSG